MLTKSNSNLIFGLIRLQTHIKSKHLDYALTKWVDSLESKLLTKENIFRDN